VWAETPWGPQARRRIKKVRFSMSLEQAILEAV